MSQEGSDVPNSNYNGSNSYTDNVNSSSGKSGGGDLSSYVSANNSRSNNTQFRPLPPPPGSNGPPPPPHLGNPMPLPPFPPGPPGSFPMHSPMYHTQGFPIPPPGTLPRPLPMPPPPHMVNMMMVPPPGAGGLPPPHFVPGMPAPPPGMMSLARGSTGGQPPPPLGMLPPPPPGTLITPATLMRGGPPPPPHMMMAPPPWMIGRPMGPPPPGGFLPPPPSSQVRRDSVQSHMSNNSNDGGTQGGGPQQGNNNNNNNSSRPGSYAQNDDKTPESQNSNDPGNNFDAQRRGSELSLSQLSISEAANNSGHNPRGPSPLRPSYSKPLDSPSSMNSPSDNHYSDTQIPSRPPSGPISGLVLPPNINGNTNGADRNSVHSVNSNNSSGSGGPPQPPPKMPAGYPYPPPSMVPPPPPPGLMMMMPPPPNMSGSNSAPGSQNSSPTLGPSGSYGVGAPPPFPGGYVGGGPMMQQGSRGNLSGPGLVRVGSQPTLSGRLVDSDSISITSSRASSAMPQSNQGSSASIPAADIMGATNAPESLETYRENAKRSNDPALQLEFAKYLIVVADQLIETAPDPDPRKLKKSQDALYQEALKWVKKLATSSSGRPAYSEAMFFLAECYGNGTLNLTVDHDKAFQLYLTASKQSHPGATYRSAVCYEVGAGTKRDHPKAAQFYRKAASLGDTAAMYKLGMILLGGLLGVAKNSREGVTWLKRAASQADATTPHALHELGVLYEGKGDTNGSIIPDPAYAHDLFLKAAQLGYSPSQYKLGLCYEYGHLGLPVEPRRSIAWYTRAAEQGDPEAELALSGWYLTGADGVLKQSDTEAYLWARKAADKGLAKAEYAVGYYVEHGVGVRADVEEARRWYLRAAGQGNKRALQRLKELKGYAAMANAQEKGRRGDWRKDGDAKNGDCAVM